MKYVITFLMALHGLIHLAGFVKSLNPGRMLNIMRNVSRPLGIVSLMAALLIILSSVLYFFENEYWWVSGSIAIIFSQIFIIVFWSDAKYGTIINLLMILPLLIGYNESKTDSFKKIFNKEVEAGLRRTVKQGILKEAELLNLPEIVKKYITFSGAIGREKILNLNVKFEGGIITEKGGDFLDCRVDQYNFFVFPKRVFYIDSRLYGIKFDALHLYKENKASMKIKLLSLIQVADAKGEKMTQSETVTMFNDMCLLAPATLIDKNIIWKEIDSTSVKAQFSNAGYTITAVLQFKESGELINFYSDDRFESSDGKIYKRYRWSTPVEKYADFDGRKLPVFAKAIWHYPEGDFCYAKFIIKNIEYNVKNRIE